jgi:hypothetical protein
MTTLIASSIIGVDTARAVFPTGAAGCSIAKLRAATKMFSCLVRERSKELRGKTSDAAACADKLTGAFAKANGKGQCPTIDDSAFVLGRVQHSSEGVFDDLAAGTATAEQLPCVLSKAKLAVRYAKCQTDALGKRIGGLYVGVVDDFAACRDGLETAFSKVEAHTSCATTGSAAVRDTTAETYGYLPSFDWGTNPCCEHMFYASSAPLPHAYMPDNDLERGWLVGSNFTGADLTGSNLRQTMWQYSDLTGADLSGADLAGASLRHYTVLQGVILAGANLFGATLTEAELTNADLHGATATQADFSAASFASADLTGVLFAGSELIAVDWTGTVCPDGATAAPSCCNHLLDTPASCSP